MVALASVENIGEATIIGQGRAIVLSQFESGLGNTRSKKLSGEEARPERLLQLQIQKQETEDGTGVRLQLCDYPTHGVDLIMTETQRLDLLRTIRVAQFGRPSEIPGNSGYQRVDADGNDTWNKSRSIEKRHQPDLSVF